jgi:serine/threonine protein kinase
LEEIGRGGMAVVHKARQVKLNRVVALKMMLRADAVSRARFLAEAEAVAAIQHPHVVQVFDYGDHAGTPFLAMEYVPGGTLADALASPGCKPRVAPRDAASLLQKIASGVAAAHDLGIVHRDLKPSNVLLASPDRQVGGSPPLDPRVADFGLAKRTAGADLTHTHVVMGTPAYMAPEQAKGAKFAGPPADVWALGVILYECLTGSRPFGGDDAQSTLDAVLNTAPVPARKLVPRLPRDLETILGKCLTKDPYDRYPTAKELADDLGRFTRGESILARPVGLVRRGIKWARRNPTLTSLLVAVVASLAVGLAVSITYAVRADREAERARRALDDRDRAVARQQQLAREFYLFLKHPENLSKAERTRLVNEFLAQHPELSREEFNQVLGGGQAAQSATQNFDGD